MRIPTLVATLAVAGSVAFAAPAGQQVVLEVKLPKPAFVGTPKNIPPGTTVEKPSGKKRPPLMVPAGTANLSLKKPVTGSYPNPLIGEMSQVTDGSKEADEGSYVELGKGKQWVQVDLKKPCTISAIVVWHYHGDPRVYHDVVVQTALDRDFIKGVTTAFNNDQNNTLGLGAGKDREYFETFEGRLIEVKGVKARFVRLYSNGSTADELNRITEVEVHGRTAE